MDKTIIEYKVTTGNKLYVTSNIDFKGQGIRKTGTGKDHRRGLLTFTFTEAAFKKMKAVHNVLKYIESDY